MNLVTWPLLLVFGVTPFKIDQSKNQNRSMLDVWISDETLLLVFDILLLGVWISDEILLLVFDLLLFSVWMKPICLMFDIWLLDKWSKRWKKKIKEKIITEGHILKTTLKHNFLKKKDWGKKKKKDLELRLHLSSPRGKELSNIVWWFLFYLLGSRGLFVVCCLAWHNRLCSVVHCLVSTS